jgi:hypothetical protein
MPDTPIEDIFNAHVSRLMAIPGVTGVGIGDCNGRPCLRVFVLQNTPQLSQSIPPMLDGYSVEVVETGPVRPLSP